MSEKKTQLLRADQAVHCPYCRQDDCIWSISTIDGAGSAEVRTGCGQALSADGLLGKIRWHLEAGARDMHVPRASQNKNAAK